MNMCVCVCVGAPAYRNLLSIITGLRYLITDSGPRLAKAVLLSLSQANFFLYTEKIYPYKGLHTHMYVFLYGFQSCELFPQKYLKNFNGFSNKQLSNCYAFNNFSFNGLLGNFKHLLDCDLKACT